MKRNLFVLLPILIVLLGTGVAALMMSSPALMMVGWLVSGLTGLIAVAVGPDASIESL